MTTSLQTTFLSEIARGDHPISENTLAYLQERAKSRLYDYVLKKFLEEEKCGLTRAQLARRIGKSPEVITRMLGAPGNWTIETLADLLVGISSEEILPASESLIDRPKKNYAGKMVEKRQLGLPTVARVTSAMAAAPVTTTGTSVRSTFEIVGVT